MQTAGAIRVQRGAVTVDGSGGFAIGGVTVDLPDSGRVHLARVTGEGVATGARFTARRLRVDNLVFGMLGWRMEAGRIELEGLDLPALVPADFFGRGNAGLAATVRELNVARGSISAIDLRMAGYPSLSAHMGEIAVLDVSSGIARRIAFSASGFNLRDPRSAAPDLSVDLGPITIETADLGLEADTIAPLPGAPRERRVAYARVRAAGGRSPPQC